MISKLKAKYMDRHLSTIVFDIGQLNTSDSLQEFVNNTKLEVVTDYAKCAEFGGDRLKHSFMVTDNRKAAFFALNNGIGIAVYTNGINNASDFPEALYCIERISDMTDINLEKMYRRANGIPWDILETDRCLVREITVDDVDDLYRIYDDDETKLYIEDLYANREDEIRFTEEYIANQYRFYEFGLWVVSLKSNPNALIGRAGIFTRDGQDEVEIGFVFDKKYWGMGIASEVLLSIIKYAREEHDITELVANVHIDNFRSMRLLEKLGFRYNKQSEVDGKPYSQYIYTST